MTHRITLVGYPMDITVCPPPLVYALWPSYDGWPVEMNPTECLVTVPASAPAPVDLGPLVKVETINPAS